jgi:hypothetical protein
MTELSCVLVETRLRVEPIFERHIKFLPDVKLFAQTRGVNSIEDYNRLLTSLSFWESISTEKVLIIQHDSEILRTGIEEFYSYDYVGAPWVFQEHGGNGGFSLRSVSAMIDTIKKHDWKGENEDIFFSNNLEGRLAPRGVCSRFSCEEIFKLGTLGAHAIDKHLTRTECEKIRKQYI